MTRRCFKVFPIPQYLWKLASKAGSGKDPLRIPRTLLLGAWILKFSWYLRQPARSIPHSVPASPIFHCFRCALPTFPLSSLAQSREWKEEWWRQVGKQRRTTPQLICCLKRSLQATWMGSFIRSYRLHFLKIGSRTHSYSVWVLKSCFSPQQLGISWGLHHCFPICPHKNLGCNTNKGQHNSSVLPFLW